MRIARGLGLRCMGRIGSNDMKLLRIFSGLRLWAGLYATVALVTFGYSAANAETYAECEARNVGKAYHCGVYASALGVSTRAVFASALWPFYWSWEIQT